MNMNRRQFVKFAGAAGLLPMVGAGVAGCNSSRTGSGRIVVVGGGFGGATAAKFIKKYNPALDVTLVEAKTTYTTCPASNWVLGGIKPMSYITHNFENLKKRGIKVIHDTVQEIDVNDMSVKLHNGATLAYEKLIVSPGIDFKWGEIEGVTEANAEKIPHAWQAGQQTVLLKKQIENMRQGGTFVMVAPPNPYRCPPGPYERISMVAHYFKQHNPKAKIIVLDPKDAFSKQGLFLQAWQDLYGDMIEWVPAKDGGKVSKIDVENMIVHAEIEKIKADVINAIPAQKAGALAFKTGLTNETGFCPVNMLTFESTIHKNIHVIGDACIAGAMPKSGHAATSQAKTCAAAIVNGLAGMEMPMPTHVNTCYSLLSDKYAISVAGVYILSDSKIVEIKGAGGVSPKDADASFREMEAMYTFGWYSSITQDVWGS